MRRAQVSTGHSRPISLEPYADASWWRQQIDRWTGLHRDWRSLASPTSNAAIAPTPPVDLFPARFLLLLLFGVVGENPPTYTGAAAVAAKTAEKRVTEVEYKVAENARSIDGLREAIVEGFKAMDRRFEAMDHRFEAMDRRFEAMEQRFDRRLEVVDENMSRQFRWIVGIQITTLLAMIGAAIGAIAAAALGR